MKRIFLLSLSIACALLLIAPPARPAASDSSPLVASVGIAPPAMFTSPLHVPAAHNEKAAQQEPLWMNYWRWVLFH